MDPRRDHDASRAGDNPRLGEIEGAPSDVAEEIDLDPAPARAAQPAGWDRVEPNPLESGLRRIGGALEKMNGGALVRVDLSEEEHAAVTDHVSSGAMDHNPRSRDCVLALLAGGSVNCPKGYLGAQVETA